jgi:flavin reductase (DIM6/NTAB) family NADH-FMN oxidoreductase RutF
MDSKRRLGPLPMIFPMPALLVGTTNDDGTANAMTAAWAAICCQSPPCAGVAIRSSRLTFANVVARRAFTLNVPRADDAAAVDYLGIVSGREDPGKLARAGFETVPGAVVEAPILIECPVNVECRLRERLDLGTHTWFVGEIVEVHVDEACLDAGGKVELGALDPLVFTTSRRAYHRLGAAVGRAFDIGRAIGGGEGRER